MNPSLSEIRSSCEHYSVSSINTYINCSLQYFFKYVEKLKPSHTSICLPFGTAYHTARAFIANANKAKQKITLPETVAIFSDAFAAAVALTENLKAEAGEANVLEETGRKMIESLCNSMDPNEFVIECNKAFIIPVEGVELPLIGELDMLTRNQENGRLRIVDFKTAARKWPEDKAQKDLQASAYCMAFQAEYNTIPDFRFEVCTKTKKPEVQILDTSRTERDIAKFANIVRAVDHGIKSKVFVPNCSSFFCSDCPLKQHCENW